MRASVLEETKKDEIHHPSSPASMSIFPFHEQKTVCTIAAHEGTLAAITFNAAGSKLASASEKVSVLCVLTGSPPARGLLDGLPRGQRANGASLVTQD